VDSVTELAFVTQLIDPEDPALGFVIGMVEALAQAFDRITVIANHVRVTPMLPPNVEVRSLGKEHGRQRFSRGVAFESEIVRFIRRRRRPAAMLVHMCPEYLNLAAPLARVGRVRSMLWFAHPSDSWKLATAERLADVILTSLPGSFPRASDKVRIIGQAIDTERFTLLERDGRLGDGTRLLAIGRTSPSKGFEQMIDALKRVRADGRRASLHIVGPSTTRDEEAHAARLRQLIASGGLADSVAMLPGVPAAMVPDLFRGSDILINAMVSGSGDKVVFEAMATGVIPIVSNPSFADLLGELPLNLMFEAGNSSMLAERIEEAAGADPGVLHAVRATLRRRVVDGHSMPAWALRVRAAAEGRS
jgi:glycosyltransferase involved in cell wall biosynthesis